MTAPWSAERIAAACGARIEADPGGAARGFAIDSREVELGDLFVGIPGDRVDGGDFARSVLEEGAWGALVTPAAAASAAGAPGALLVHPEPVRALGRIAAEHRAGLSCRVIGVTGSSGKTSTKDILASVLSTAGETLASRGNRNTDIGMPLEILRASDSTAFLVLEMAMRGRGQIADLVEIARPDVGVIVSVGPAHLDLLGSMEEIAAAKAELIAGLSTGSVAVVPAGERLLEPHLRDDLTTLRFGDGGDVSLVSVEGRDLVLSVFGEEATVSVDFDQPHNRLNLLASIAAADAVGVRPPRDLQVSFSALRGERIPLGQDILLINDCYNANPSSVAFALDDLREEVRRRGGRSVAVLGDMLELGPDEVEFHRRVGARAAETGVDLLVAVGPLAAGIAEGFAGRSVSVASASEAAEEIGSILEPGDTVLIKGSRGVGLDAVARSIEGGD